jgi:Transposase DDE domain group 1
VRGPRLPQAGRRLRPHPRAANAAWLVIATLAHSLLRWVAQIGLGARGELVVAKTLRRTLLALPGRITRSARRWKLHLPRRATPRPARVSMSVPEPGQRATRTLAIVADRSARLPDAAASPPPSLFRPA